MTKKEKLQEISKKEARIDVLDIDIQIRYQQKKDLLVRITQLNKEISALQEEIDTEIKLLEELEQK